MRTTAQLLAAHRDAWSLALDNPFRAAIKLGTLPSDDFARWLTQARHLDGALFVAASRLLAQAPERTRGALVEGLRLMDRDRVWCDGYLARLRTIADGVQPVARAYADFLLNAATGPYAAGLTAVWGTTQARLDGWVAMRTVGSAFREYVTAGRTPARQGWVRSLRHATDEALAEASARDSDAAAAAFGLVVRHELEFWAMALEKAPPVIVG